MNETINWATLSIIGSTVATVFTLTWWLSGQFSNVRKFTADMKDKILEKLEYHEQHDDKRFAEVNNGIWELRLRDAAKQYVEAKNGNSTNPK